MALALPLGAAAAGQGGFLETLSIFLYGVIGFFGAVSILAFVGGFVLYIIRLGTDRRREGLIIMEWGVTMLFVVVILIFILNWVK